MNGNYTMLVYELYNAINDNYTMLDMNGNYTILDMNGNYTMLDMNEWI